MPASFARPASTTWTLARLSTLGRNLRPEERGNHSFAATTRVASSRMLMCAPSGSGCSNSPKKNSLSSWFTAPYPRSDASVATTSVGTAFQSSAANSRIPFQPSGPASCDLHSWRSASPPRPSRAHFCPSDKSRTRRSRTRKVRAGRPITRAAHASLPTNVSRSLRGRERRRKASSTSSKS